jgi:hypothetical protein
MAPFDLQNTALKNYPEPDFFGLFWSCGVLFLPPQILNSLAHDENWN